MIRILLASLFFLLFSVVTALFLPIESHAGETVVLEGDKGKAKYEESKGQSQTLKQLDKVFTLISPDGSEQDKPKEITVKVGEYLFITNNEDKIVHNVYDQSDNSWVLKKQEPGGVAGIAFGEPGEHKLRCAIHPKMKVKVKVVP